MVRRLTTAQAIVKFLRVQYSARDGREQQFFGECRTNDHLGIGPPGCRLKNLASAQFRG